MPSSSLACLEGGGGGGLGKRAQGAIQTCKRSRILFVFLPSPSLSQLPPLPGSAHSHFFFLLLPNPNIKRKQNGAFAHLSEQRLQVRGRRTMGIEQGLFLFVHPAHSLTPEVVFFCFLVVLLFCFVFFPPLVFVLETYVCA